MVKFLRFTGYAICGVMAGYLLYGCDDGENKGPKADPAIDLTADAAYANCFIVDKAGVYKFAAKYVDGSDVAGISAADWLWSTNEVAEGLVSDVSYSKGYIRFKAAAQKGNAVIAAFDAEGKIVWSWHLWFSDVPAVQTYDNESVFMDRDLGAMSAVAADGPKTFGLKYQWGRKDPIYAGESDETEATTFERAREHTILNPAYAGKMAWTAVKGDEQTGTMSYATEHPTTFIYLTTTGKDWLATPDDTLWGDGDKKSNYDPCPAGYRIPKGNAWNGLRTDNTEVDEVNRGITFTTQTGDVLWYPFNGARWGDKGAGYLSYIGEWGTGCWWARSVEGGNGGAFYVMDGGYVAGGGYGMYRAHGETVRCISGIE